MQGKRVGVVLAIVGVLVGVSLLGGCQSGPGKAERSTQQVIVVESSAFIDAAHQLEADFAIPAITAEIVERGTVQAYMETDPGDAQWTALPYAYQHPEKWAALVTYRYEAGRFTLLIVSPNPELRQAIAARIDGYRVKIVVTTP